MNSSFRLEASELASWHAVLGQRMDLRGVPAIAKEVEAHLARKESDGTVVVSRHQLFTWAEALQGVAARDPGNAIAPVVAEMRSILSGKPASASERTFPAPSLGAPGPGTATGGPRSGQEMATTERTRYAAPAPVTYARAPSPSENARVLTGSALSDAVREIFRHATREVYVSSPWATGVETLLGDIRSLAPSIRVLLLSRRPERDDAAFHQAMDELGRRRAVTAWSPFIQTRMIVADDTRAIVGAASHPGNNSREVGVVITDAATVRELRAAFERAHAEAAGGKY